MNTQEFDTEFDVLYNNITSNQAPGLNGYEKSVFLTKAENQLLSEYFNHRTDVDGGFDGSEERQIDFSSLINTNQLYHIRTLAPDYVRVDLRSFVFQINQNILYVLNEFLDIKRDDNTVQTLKVVPLAYDEYKKLMSKPYKYPLKGQAWRLLNGSPMQGRCFEIVTNDSERELSYRITYVRKPKPIILENLSALGVSIDGEDSITNCELPEETHHKILERAVALAKIAWQGTTMTQAAMAAEASRQR